VSENKDILKVAANFYRELFKKEGRGECSLGSDFGTKWIASLWRNVKRWRLPSLMRRS
jgi:hypothetical protein